MYTSLVLITWAAIVLLSLFVCVYALGWETNTKTHYWGLLWLIPQYDSQETEKTK